MMNSGKTQRLSRLTPLTAALACLDGLAQPVAPRDIELAAAAGRVLAADATAATPVPATAIALRDGWAVQSDVVHDAGSYAPVTLLIDERDSGVHLAYDQMASVLAPYGDSHALQVAEDLDRKVDELMHRAAG